MDLYGGGSEAFRIAGSSSPPVLSASHFAATAKSPLAASSTLSRTRWVRPCSKRCHASVKGRATSTPMRMAAETRNSCAEVYAGVLGPLRAHGAKTQLTLAGGQGDRRFESLPLQQGV
jgi:hypothetical protein